MLRAVATSDAYANLVLPPLLAERGIRGRDAAFATELAYGTLRLRGRYDAVLSRASSRPLDRIDPPLLDVLRLGTHQLLGMRVPAHAAVAETVALAREVTSSGPAQFANAVLRAVAARESADWLALIREDPEPLATEHSHPAWIVRALRESLVGNGRPAGEIGDLLAADNEPPQVNLVARPGLVTAAELSQEAAEAGLRVAGPGLWAPGAIRLAGGDPRALASVRAGLAAVQDEGSQLVALAAARVAAPGRWLDLCAGPGGKAALLGSELARRAEGGVLVANEPTAHRADLVRRATRALPAGSVEIRTEDGREAGRREPGAYDLVLVDAPCTGLGALRRRPESRWRRRPEDLTHLTALQADLLAAAVTATAPGGVVAYTTCSPHLAETHAVASGVLRAGGVEALDAPAALRAVATAPLPDLGPGPWAQLWPHRHGVDGMFFALLRRIG